MVLDGRELEQRYPESGVKSAVTGGGAQAASGLPRTHVDAESSRAAISVASDGCARCYVPPKSLEDYWRPKIENNRRRDRSNAARARRAGLRVMVPWEHDLEADAAGFVARALRRIRARPQCTGRRRDSGRSAQSFLSRRRSISIAALWKCPNRSSRGPCQHAQGPWGCTYTPSVVTSDCPP